MVVIDSKVIYEKNLKKVLIMFAVTGVLSLVLLPVVIGFFILPFAVLSLIVGCVYLIFPKWVEKRVAISQMCLRCNKEFFVENDDIQKSLVFDCPYCRNRLFSKDKELHKP